MMMHRFLDVLNRLPFESQRDVVVTHSFERVVPKDPAIERQSEDMAVAAGVNDAVANNHRNIFVGGRAQDARLEFHAPKFGPGLDVHRGHVTVAADVKVLFHDEVLARRRGVHDYKSKRKFYCACVIALFCFALNDFAKQQNWPQWRGPNMNGATDDAGAPTSWSTNSNVLWRVALPEAGNSSPIVWKDRVFVTQAIGKRRALMCVDRRSGAVLWTVGPTYELPEPTMKESNPYCAASPVTDGKHVIAHFGSAGLYCYDFSGRKLWNSDLGAISHPFGPASSPVLDANRCFVFVGPGESTNEFMVAVDTRTGKTVWRAPALQPNAQEMTKVSSNGPPIGTWSTPLVIEHGKRKEVVMPFDFRFGAYDAKSGKLLWENAGLGLQTYVTPLWTDEMVIAQSGTTTLAVRPPHEIAWAQPKSKFRFGSGLATDKHLFYLAENGLAECWEKETGKVLWQERLQGPGKKTTSWSSLSMAGDKIYAPNQSGDVFVFAADPMFRVLSTNSVAEPTNASLAIAQGNVIMRTDRALWCFGSDKS
jgi:outer membrane protein assembly factor BamB